MTCGATGGPRVALITGCGKPTGIGAATARRFARSGINVMVADIRLGGRANDTDEPASAPDDGLPSLVAELTAIGVRGSAVLGDVSSESDARRMVDTTVDTFGRLDILVNNAGAPHGAEYDDIASVPTAAWDAVIAINLRGTFLLTREAVRVMRPRGWGRIVNVSSLAGKMGLPRQAAYSASKAGVIGLTRSVAHDVASDGITVNAVCPGLITTSRATSAARRSGDGDVELELARRASRVPVGRLGEPGDVAATIAFLVSDEAAFLTGQSYNVDGGVLMA